MRGAAVTDDPDPLGDGDDDGGIDLATGAGRATGDEAPDRSARQAAVAFAVVIVAAAPLLLWLGNQRWFSSDEWGFLASYSFDDLGGLFAPQNGHWSTIPVIAFLAVFQFVGLRDYWVYQLMSVATHLLAVVLVRVVMRRAGVRPWVATLAAVTLLLFGSGQQNIFVAIQISFVGAFVLGVTQFLLADHEGRLGWRDGLGILAGIAALMCSAVGVAMIPVVAVAVLLRRGWLVAAVHVVPLVAVYGSWFLVKHPRTTAGTADVGPAAAAGNVARWDLAGEAATFRDLAAHPLLGVVLAAVLVGGLALAWWGLPWRALRATQGGPVALLVGGLAFLTLTGWSRWMLVGVEAVGDQSRYQYMVAAFTIPALGVAADAIAVRWRVAVPALGVLFLIGLVGNLRAFRDTSIYVGPRWDHHRDVVVASALSPYAPTVSPNLRPDPEGAFFLTMGWLLETERSGRVPAPTATDPGLEAEIGVRLGFGQNLFGPARTDCQTVESVTITPAKGQIYTITPAAGAAIGVRSVDAAGAPTSPVVRFVGPQGRFFGAERADQRLEISSTEPGTELTICS